MSKYKSYLSNIRIIKYEKDTNMDYTEKQKLENMFLGDKSRDASDKIRGFLYQDLVAIDYLLNDETDYICVEFLEDINVFCNDGTLKVIQVKYYPKKDPVMEEIMTDLYYQYLRIELLKANFKIEFLLVLYRRRDTRKPKLARMKKYIKYYKLYKPKAEKNMLQWLEKNIYVFNKKEEQKKYLFLHKAYSKSISDFLNKFDIKKVKSIMLFQEEIADKLVQHFPESDIFDDEEDRKKILLGLALEYIQRRYTLDEPDFDKVHVKKLEFQNYIHNILDKVTEEYISAYIRTCVTEVYIEIIEENPHLHSKELRLLNDIVYNSQNWLSKLAATKNGQFQIINTVSYKNAASLKNFKDLSIKKRILKIAECNTGIQTFLNYLWKIMLDLCVSKRDFNFTKDSGMLIPETYVDSTVNNYICVKFKQDMMVSSVILPTVRADFKHKDHKNIHSRMYLDKPRKWYMAGLVCGRKEYDYSPSDIQEGDSVMDVADDSYYVECMNCIGIDLGEWDTFENCENCIFASNCIKGKDRE